MDKIITDHLPVRYSRLRRRKPIPSAVSVVPRRPGLSRSNATGYRVRNFVQGIVDEYVDAELGEMIEASKGKRFSSGIIMFQT